MKRVVLVRPAGPRNVGLVLRLVENFGPCELVLVRPEKPSLLVHPEFEQMSHGVEEAAARVSVVETLPQALADCHHVVGFTARGRDELLLEDWRAARGSLAELGARPGERLALVFGNEQMGLDATEAGLCQRLVHIRTSPRHTSLNLAAAVAVVLEPLFCGEARVPNESGGFPLPGAHREFLKAHLKAILAERVARGPAASRDVANMIERVFSRAPLETRDARAWHLVLRALGSTHEPRDFGIEPESNAGGGVKAPPSA